MYDKTKVFPIREPEGGGGGGGDVTAAGNNTFTGVNTFENNVNLGKSDSIITVNGTLKDGGGNEYVTTTDVATKNSTGVVQIGDYIDVDENGVISSNDTRKASIEALKDGTLVPKLADNMTPYAEDSGTTQTQPFFLEGTATGNGESRVDAKQVPAYAFLQEKRGNMICVNQLVDTSFTGTEVSFSEGYLTTTNTTGGAVYRALSTNRNFIKDHKYLVFLSKVDKDESVIPGNSYLLVADDVTSFSLTSIVTAANDYTGRIGFVFGAAAAANSYYKAYISVVDLTQWFNGNIPSYLLSHPEAFGRYYKGSLAYEPGRLEPATGRYFTSVGRNIWDEEWEVGSLDNTTGEPVTDNSNIRAKNYCQCSSNTSYYFYSGSGKTLRIYWYDSNKNIIDNYTVLNATRVSPNNAHYFKIRTTGAYGNAYNNDITISLYYPGESGYDKYYPYEVLATIDTGTESLYSAGSAYDSKIPSGLITRRIGSVDLGTLNWTKGGGGSAPVVFYANVSDKKLETGNMLCINYTTAASGQSWQIMPDKSITGNTVYPLIYIKDSAYDDSDVASFKAAMSGVMLYYELATPTTEQGTPFQENIPIDDFGQLSWSNTDVPQGNQIFYPVDYKAYEDTLIKYTDGDATSLVRKTDYASASEAGVVKTNPTYGTATDGTGTLYVNQANENDYKVASTGYRPVTPQRQYRSVFYGLSRAAGVNLASSTEETAPNGTNPGVYPAAAKQAICNLIGAQSAVEVVRLI